MRKEVKFYCDLCNKSFDNETMAAACEKSHFTIDKIKKVRYDRFEAKSQYPESILVVLSSGEEVNYYRKGYTGNVRQGV